MNRFIVVCSLLMIYNKSLLAANPQTSKTQHVHKEVEISNHTPVPQLKVQLYKDERDGFNLHINLINYEIEAPESAATDKTQTILEGHAHLFINGVKIRRLYSRYAHLNADLFNNGINMVTVTLNSHQHDTWTYNKRPLTSSVTIDNSKDNPFIHHFSSSPIEKP